MVETTIMRTLKRHFPDDTPPTVDTRLKQTTEACILSAHGQRTHSVHDSASVQSALAAPPGGWVCQWRDVHMSLRTALSIGIVAVLTLTAALVHVPWSVVSHANIIDLNTRLNLHVIESIGGRIDALLDGAVAVRDA